MKILIATDGSKYSRAAIEQCSRYLSTISQAEIMILSAYEPVAPMSLELSAFPNEYYVQANAELRRNGKNLVAAAEKIISRHFPGKKVAIQTSVVEGNPKREIIDAAKSFGADLIVVGSHGYGFIDRLLLGSVSNYVIHNSPCSVLVVRESDDAE
jgi:nucleotide-binding universal stress UspA family protein